MEGSRQVLAGLVWGFRSHYYQSKTFKQTHVLTQTHTHTSFRHDTPTLSLPSVGRGWVQIRLLLLEKCQSLRLPCREEEDGRKKGMGSREDGRGGRKGKRDEGVRERGMEGELETKQKIKDEAMRVEERDNDKGEDMFF